MEHGFIIYRLILLTQWIPFKTILLVKSDTKAVVIVIPADGPSFPIAPAGK